MPPAHVVNVDLAKVWTQDEDGRRRYLTTLAWGDPVEVAEITDDFVRLVATSYERKPDGSIERKTVDGYIDPPEASGLEPADCVVDIADHKVLKVDFVDVQQGDGSILETPGGQVVLIDGGMNQLFARYLAARFDRNKIEDPKDVEAVVVTHGDADHFAGLVEIYQSETHSYSKKRMFMRPKRVFHNGLVKRPETVDGHRLRETELLGATAEAGGQTLITELVDDLTTVDDAQMNKHFKDWKEALSAYASRGPLEQRRLELGDDKAFDFLTDEGLEVEVLGPIPVEADGVRGLPFLGTPRPDAELGGQPVGPRYTGKSASHTINGHSIILKITYGRARFLFSGDLNAQAGDVLSESHREGRISLRAEVFKAPHHGSADFSIPLLEAVAPVISVISSGDENALQEYIHPRATLVGALGRYSRDGVPEPLIFVTEMVAFFESEGWIQPEFHRLSDGAAVVEDGEVLVDPKSLPSFFAFRRAAFGLVKVRTDGSRLVVWTNSGQTDLKEVYAYELSDGTPQRVALRRA